MHEMNAVRDHFHHTAQAFDSFYGGRRGFLARWVDQRFRQDLYDRFRLTFEACRPLEGASLLDVGCGSGRYAVEAARRGASHVVGVDFAPRMIALAWELAGQEEVGQRCLFLEGDFLEIQFDERFDFSLALGLFDYTPDPVPFLRKMRALTRRKIVASFPRNTFPRAWQRRVRYRLKGCPVYFYSQSDVEAILVAAGLPGGQITTLQGDYFVAVPTQSEA